MFMNFEFEKYSMRRLSILFTAAWFHDSGYVHGHINHEEESTKIASRFLNDLNVNPKFVIQIHALILATKLPATPANPLQEMLCDADMHHLGSKDYLKWSNQLYTEIQVQKGTPIDEVAWIKENISFFKTHHYFTEYAITYWENQKQLNLQALIRTINALLDS